MYLMWYFSIFLHNYITLRSNKRHSWGIALVNNIKPLILGWFQLHIVFISYKCLFIVHELLWIHDLKCSFYAVESNWRAASSLTDLKWHSGKHIPTLFLASNPSSLHIFLVIKTCHKLKTKKKLKKAPGLSHKAFIFSLIF